MNLEDQVVSLELSKELKKAGYKQEGIWWWICHHGVNDDFLLSYSREMKRRSKDLIECIVAPTVAELGEILKKGYNYWMQPSFDNGDIGFTTSLKYWEWLKNDTEANARAKMWLHLKKEGLL